MPHVITITGPSGAGKSTTLRYLLKKDNKTFHPVMVSKYTDRPKHKDDQGEVICLEQLPESCDLCYVQYSANYGIALNTLLEHIKQGESPIVILNDIRAVEDVRSIFGEMVRSIFVFRESPTRERFEKLAKTKGLVDEEDIQRRFLKAQTLYRIYIENIHIFDNVLINSGTRTELKVQLTQFVKSLNLSNNWPLTKGKGK